jgi:hypothetical protein
LDSDFNDLFGSVSFYDEVLKNYYKQQKTYYEKYDSKQIGSQLNGIIEKKTKMIAIEFRKRLKIMKLNIYVF